MSTDGINWSRLNNGNPIIVPQTGILYGAGHPSIIYLGGYFYLSYDDTTGANFGVYALRSQDPTFQSGVQEWRNGSWYTLSSAPTTQYPFLTTATNTDWAYSPALREFIVAIDGKGERLSGDVADRGTHVSIRRFNQSLT